MMGAATKITLRLWTGHGSYFRQMLTKKKQALLAGMECRNRLRTAEGMCFGRPAGPILSGAWIDARRRI